MAQYTSLERKNNNKQLIENDFSIGFKRVIHPLLMFLAGTKIGYKIIKCNSYINKVPKKFKDRPVIFVCNHSNSLDVPMAFKSIRKHTILFAGKQPLEKMDELFFNLNGTIYVDRKDKQDMALSKVAIEEALNKRRNILVFPEGTWNLTDAVLMLEMKWGIVDVAKKTNAIFIPMALNYHHDKKICMYKFGDIIDVKDMTNEEGIEKIRDSIATLRWKMFELDNPVLREDIDVEQERKEIMKNVENYPKLNYEYEKSIVFHSKPTSEEVFGPIMRLKK
jgi:1-acyl-sn-glycerol-3-phosphate acyltransferase